MEENSRDWSMLVWETLLVYKILKMSITGVSLFSITFGDNVLSLEIMASSMQVARQNKLSPEYYNELMIMKLD